MNEVGKMKKERKQARKQASKQAGRQVSMEGAIKKERMVG